MVKATTTTTNKQKKKKQKKSFLQNKINNNKQNSNENNNKQQLSSSKEEIKETQDIVSSESVSSSLSSKSTINTIIKRIKHSNTTIRLASLSIFVHQPVHTFVTKIYNKQQQQQHSQSQSQSQKSHNTQIQKCIIDLLQVIREQVVSNDLHCSVTATQCLSNYLYNISYSSTTTVVSKQNDEIESNNNINHNVNNKDDHDVDDVEFVDSIDDEQDDDDENNINCVVTVKDDNGNDIDATVDDDDNNDIEDRKYSHNSNNNNNSDENDTNNDNTMNLLTAGWIVLFIGRIQTFCIPQIQRMEQNRSSNNNISNNTNTNVLYYYQLIEQCIRCIVYLIETNTYVIERLIRNKKLHDDCFIMLYTLVQHCTSTTTNATTNTTSTNTAPTIITTTDNGNITVDYEMDDCTIISNSNNNNSNNNKKKKNKKQQKRDESIANINHNNNNNNSTDIDNNSQNNKSNSNTKHNTNTKPMSLLQQQQHQQQLEQILICKATILSLACRCLHSLFDDDTTGTSTSLSFESSSSSIEIIIPYIQQQSLQFKQLLDVLYNNVIVSLSQSTVMQLPPSSSSVPESDTTTTAVVTTTTTASTTVTDDDDNAVTGIGADAAAAITSKNTTSILHAIGAWIALWKIVRQSKSNNHSNNNNTIPEEIVYFINDNFRSIVQKLVTVVCNILSINNNNINNHSNTLVINTMIQELTLTYNSYQKQLNDSYLENTIIQNVSEKSESARAIARRQQQMKHEQKQKHQQQQQQDSTLATSNDDMIMDNDITTAPTSTVDDMVDDKSSHSNERNNSKKINHDNWEEIWETQYQYFNDTFSGPLQLALEIIANITSTTSSTNTTEMDDDDDDNDHNDAKSNIEMDDELVSILIESTIPQTIVLITRLLLSNGVWRSSTINDDNVNRSTSNGLPTLDDDATKLRHVSSDVVVSDNDNDNNSFSSTIPVPIRQIGSDLQTKAVVCLRHCIVSNLLTMSDNDGIILWKQLFRPVFNQLQDTSSNVQNQSKNDFTMCLLDNDKNAVATGTGADNDVQRTLSLTAVLSIRCTPTLQKYIISSSDDINMITSVLDTHTNSISNAVTYPALVRDCIAILGIVCSQQIHSKEINYQVCSSIGIVLQSWQQRGNNMIQQQKKNKVKVSLSQESIYFSYHYSIIISESLNTLMDIYGTDENEKYISLFIQNSNSNTINTSCYYYFIQSIPILKKHITVLRTTLRKKELQQLNDSVLLDDSSCVTMDDIEQWDDVALNATRFVQYIKEQTI